jgi:coatomer subunit beta'
MGKMRLEIKRVFSARTDRVKCVDMHPTEPWLLAALYNGTLCLWNHSVGAAITTIDSSDLPLRSARFIARKSWIISGGDEPMIKVYNSNTFEKVIQFEAHSDYIRSLVVHPSQPYVLSCSDDLLIKLWDWENGWKNIMVFEGHSHFVMHVVFNPKDSNVFASASLDSSVKIWNISSSTPNFTLTGHEKGVNYVDFYHGSDKPFLISGSDDKTAKVWDYQTKSCVATLTGHSSNISSVSFHPDLPVILTSSEDGYLKVWHSTTYQLEHSLNYGMERIWSISCLKGFNSVAVAFDEGSLVLKLGREEPAASICTSGKLVFVKHTRVLNATLKGQVSSDAENGSRLALQLRELGTCEVFPQSISHSPNGRFVAVTGDGEYIVYTALAWRNKSFGFAVEFAWSPGNEYAIRESSGRIRVFDRQFQEKKVQIQYLDSSSEAIYSGALLGVRSGTGVVAFYDWETCSLVRRVDAAAKAVYWNEAGDYLAISCEDSVYTLRYIASEWESNQQMHKGEEGVESAFEFLHEISERVKSGCWVQDCFVFVTSSNRLCYAIGSNTFTLLANSSTSENNLSPLYLLGYVQSEQRIFYCDKDVNIFSWRLPIPVINYQTAIVQKDMELAATLLPEIAATELNKVAVFLDNQGHYELAISVTADVDHKFDLALRSGMIDSALDLAEKINSPAKWRAVAELALKKWKFDLAERCYRLANDLQGLFLLGSCKGDQKIIEYVAEMAVKEDQPNLAFSSLLILGKADKCIDQLMSFRKKLPIAALMARSHAPNMVSVALNKWRESLPTKLSSAILDVPDNE